MLTMCGIAGVILKDKPVNQENILRMTGAMTHRGPDDEGVYIDKNIGLGHRRLSIIDVCGGHQPMASEDGNISIVFNGEIFNFLEIKEELRKKGYSFKTNSDTEVVICAYREYGEKCLSLFNGFFSFVIYDKTKNILFCARDRLGQKPFFYYYDNEKFVFASALNALMDSGLIKKEMDHNALNHYFTYQYVPAPMSIYEGVKKLMPAHYMIFNLNSFNFETKRYWRLDFSKKTKLTFSEAKEALKRKLIKAVKYRLISDVPLGAFLSGGIDSSITVGIMSSLTKEKVKTFSIGFDEKKYDETDAARLISEKFNTEHYEEKVDWNDLKNILPLLVKHYGEPYADSSAIPTYYVSRYTKKHVTVALTGDAGDENFCGYERYVIMNYLKYMDNKPSRAFFKILSRMMPKGYDYRSFIGRLNRVAEIFTMPKDERYIYIMAHFSGALKNELLTEDFKNKTYSSDKYLKNIFQNTTALNFTEKLMETDINSYLPEDLLVKTDIATMANSLECRSPFLDYEIVEFAASLPLHYKTFKGVKKYILKETFKDMLPPSIINRPKMGFGVPIAEWLRGDLKDYAAEIFNNSALVKENIVNKKVMFDLLERHNSARENHSYRIWNLLCFELWHKECFGK